MGKSDIAAKIQKLMNKAQSAQDIGSIEEAATFAAKAQELMTRHKLTMSDIAFAELQNVEPIEESVVQAGPQRQAWAERLADIVAHAHQCRTLVSRGGYIWFVGHRSDREIAEYVFLVLYRICNTLSKVEGKKARKKARAAGTPHEGYGFVQSFRRGFITAIRDRYRLEEEMRRRGMTQAERGVAMVRLTGADIDKYVEDKYLTTKSGKPRSGGRGVTGRRGRQNEAGLARGRAAGEAVDIHRGVDRGARNSGQIAGPSGSTE